MFEFSPQNLVCRRGLVHAITASTVAPQLTFVVDNEVQKLPLPPAIARRLKIQTLGVTKFVIDFPIVVAMYDGHIVAAEAPTRPEFIDWQAGVEWKSNIESNIGVISRLPAGWSFDGQYVYRQSGERTALPASKFVFEDVEAYNLFDLSSPFTVDTQTLACLGYARGDGTYTTTSPVTRASGGFLQFTGELDEYDASAKFVSRSSMTDLQVLDANHIVNLKFVNYAASRLSNRFGYDVIEPLGLPLLMIEHRTMSLVSLAQSVQQTSSAPMTFTQAIAWTIGLFSLVTDLDDLRVVKSVIKMLLSKGNTQVDSISKETAVETPLSVRQQLDNLRCSLGSAPLIRF